MSDIKDKWDEAGKTEEPVSIGDTVICDYCDEDFTNSDAMGGFVFGSKACCPKCEPRMLGTIKGYNEEYHIKARCPENMSFADFIRDYRGPNNYIQITNSGEKG